MSRRCLLQSILVLGAATVATEVCCCIFFRMFSDRFTFFDPGKLVMSAKDLPKAARVFDSELGWVKQYETKLGERPRLLEYGAPLISTFGDSYVHGDQVGHGETFQHYLAKRLGADVYNFGVGGYGTDQAYLRFRRDYPSVRTPIVVLGLLSENINRIVNVYRRFYYDRTALSLTKPRFEWVDGARVLRPNPVQRVEELPRLTEREFLLEIGRHDFWYNRNDCPELGFPYSGILLNRRIWRESWARWNRLEVSDIDPRPWETLWEHDDVRALLFSIIDSFVADARSFGSQPVILLMPRKREVLLAQQGEVPQDPRRLMEYCESRRYNCFNTVPLLAKNLKNPSAVGALFRGHLTSLGNQIVARGFHRYLAANEIIPTASGDQEERRGPAGSARAGAD